MGFKNLILMLLLPQICLSDELSDFEMMLKGFPECKFEGVYLELETLIPQHKYFIDRNMKPEKIESYLAKFIVKESYYGLGVSEIYIPADTLSVVAIVINEERKNVEKKLEKY